MINKPINKSKLVLGLYLLTIVLLPFSRYSELPILILAIMGIYGLSTGWKNIKSNPQFSLLSSVFLCYFFMVLISSTDSYWQQKTLVVAFSSIRFYLASVSLLIYIQTKHIKVLFKLIAFVAVFWAIDAIAQYFIGFDIVGRASYTGRLNGIFGENHVKLGPVLAFLLPMTMIGLNKQTPIIRWLAVFLIVLVVLLSGTRSAWIMAIVTLFAYWLHHVKQRRMQLLFKSIVVSLIMMISLWFISPEFKQRIERSLTLFDGTYSGIDFALADRLSIWQTSLNMIEQHPINGVGARAFRKAYPYFASKDDVWQQQGGVGMHAHHWVLEILAETGFIGLLLFSFAIYRLLLFIKVNYNNYSWGFFIALFTMFLPITSTYSLFASFWSICIWFVGTGLIVVSKNKVNENE